MIDDPGLLPPASGEVVIESPHRRLRLGAGRVAGRARDDAPGGGPARVDSRIDPAVGVILHKKAGDRVEAGEPLCTVLVNDDAARDAAVALIRGAYAIGDEPVIAARPDRRTALIRDIQP